jgi:hypothetical protein
MVLPRSPLVKREESPSPCMPVPKSLNRPYKVEDAAAMVVRVDGSLKRILATVPAPTSNLDHSSRLYNLYTIS